jgi:hypothetical protein
MANYSKCSIANPVPKYVIAHIISISPNDNFLRTFGDGIYRPF